MRPFPTLAVLALTLTVTAAPAQDVSVLDPKVAATPGAVALFVQAEALYTQGQAGQDPLLVLAAARLMHGLTLTQAARQPAPEQPASLDWPDAARMLDRARQLDAGQSYGDLIDMLAREVPVRQRRLAGTASVLNPGQTEVWTISFFGGTYGELAILGDGQSNLDMVVTGPGDTQICLDQGSGDTAFCGFALTDNGDVTVGVHNAGTTAGRYLLLTE